ncbi:hypothetical protein VPH35_024770 [Triticum aestivum]|uniref:Uncharacterized protein n=1 Tax=Triticum aestivum TaxID=4565 RepID=A0A3B6B9K7_WHEAT|nr:uncharacterized protein LOC123186615 [Triticum aestivum]XP_044454282.1 uncharacterized protein LOC123186615 [Triticum aestivum]
MADLKTAAYQADHVLENFRYEALRCCADDHIRGPFSAMKHDKQAEKDYEEEEDNEEDEDEQGTVFEEEEDSHFDVKAPSVMICKIALFGYQRSIFLLYKVQRRSCPKFKSNDAQFFSSL